MSDLSNDLLNAEAVRFCASRIAELITEDNLQDNKELREAMAQMFQAGVSFTYQKLMELES